MATNYTAGARRSAVPRLLQAPATGQQAILSDEELMKLIFGQQAAKQAGQATPVASSSGTVASTGSSYTPALSEAIGSGTSVRSGGMNLADAGSAIGTIGNATAGLSLLGLLTGDTSLMKTAQDVSKLNSVAGAGVGLAASETPLQAATAVAPLAGSLLGIPGGLTNLGLGALSGNKAAMINAGLSFVPGVNVANTALQLLTAAGDGKVSMGDIAMNAGEGSKIFGDVGPVDATQGMMAINRSADPLGTLLGVLGENVSENPQAAKSAIKAIDVTDQNTGATGGLGYSSGQSFTVPTESESNDAADSFANTFSQYARTEG